ncbi:hypothetical protein EV421DRAFT_1733715 [Armillaria borealis]|uniref:Uncharacterized protein n=1 Tax=Armillaria borealis TaxID=47425 RepID=A0AA39MU26_9AGAR|nr:hypothetical protein EV421DRAFT_1733715 [Armillaria borealis]
MDLIIGFPDVENSGGEGWSSDAWQWGHQGYRRTEELCSPTQIIGNARVWGGWGSWAERGRPMLDIGRVDGGGRVNRRTVTILASFLMNDGPPAMPRRVYSSLSSLAVGVPILVLPSQSWSPALLPCPCLLSFGIGHPQDHAITLFHSKNPPATVVIVIVLLGVGFLVSVFVLWGISRRDGSRFRVSEHIPDCHSVRSSCAAAIGTNVGVGGCSVCWDGDGIVFVAVTAGQDTRNPGLLGPPDAQNGAKNKNIKERTVHH